MPKKSDDLTGKRFGRLLVQYRIENTERVTWHCLCDCGNSKNITRDCLVRKSNATYSCGCLRSEMSSTNKRKHFWKGTKPYRVWSNMKDRCGRESHKDFHNYGGRGIIVEEPWRSQPKLFCEWYVLQQSTLPAGVPLQVDRIDPNGNYYEANCRLVTSESNNNNRRNNLRVDYNGENLTLAELVRKYSKLPYSTVQNRIKKRWSVEDAVSAPLSPGNSLRKRGK